MNRHWGLSVNLTFIEVRSKECLREGSLCLVDSVHVCVCVCERETKIMIVC